MSYDEYQATLAGLSKKHADVVYAYGLSSLAYIRAHSDDYNALARLPHAEALLTLRTAIINFQNHSAFSTFLDFGARSFDFVAIARIFGHQSRYLDYRCGARRTCSKY